MFRQLTMDSPVGVVFCTTPSVYSTIVLRELIASPRIKLVGVVASTRILRKRGWIWRDVMLLVGRTGIRYAAYLWMVTTLYALLQRFCGDDPVTDYLKYNNVPILKTRDINTAEGVAFVARCGADLMISAHFNQLVGPDLLTLPTYGCMNIHPGKLPDYKGVDPVAHALSRGEQQVGVTVHVQDEQFDTGPVIVSSMVPVTADDSLFSLNRKLFRLGAKLLLEKLETSEGVIDVCPQPPTDTYDSWPTGKVVATIRDKKRKLISLQSLLAMQRGDWV